MLANYQMCPTSRFSGVFALNGEKPKSHNLIIAEEHGSVIVPTLGSIIPNWLLAIPRRYSMSFREHAQATGENPIRTVRSVSKRFGFKFFDVVWFEHGADIHGSETGCGVDYAHLHILLAPQFTLREMSNSVFGSTRVEWRCHTADAAYQHLSKNGNYYVFGSGDSCFVHDSGCALGSQFFRRQVAKLVGKPQAWDYRVFPFHENIELTLRLTSELSKAAA
jgi:ATP adenylyltransferase